MSRDELLQRISALDFYIIDLHLYLNTHPDDNEAILLYNNCITQVIGLRDEYSRQYGMLLANNCTSKQPWQWIENPWPWQKAFNFKLKEDLG
jgi:spore coat protein JB